MEARVAPHKYVGVALAGTPPPGAMIGNGLLDLW